MWPGGELPVCSPGQQETGRGEVAEIQASEEVGLPGLGCWPSEGDWHRVRGETGGGGGGGEGGERWR